MRSSDARHHARYPRVTIRGVRAGCLRLQRDGNALRWRDCLKLSASDVSRGLNREAPRAAAPRALLTTRKTGDEAANVRDVHIPIAGRVKHFRLLAGHFDAE